jgi:hypothetical protein
MRAWIIGSALALAGVIHLLPLAGVLGGERLAQLYGLRVDDPNLALLLRHRAVLFGLLGALLLGAVWRPAWQGIALAAGLASTIAFLLLAAGSPLNAALQRVWWADVLAVAALLLAAALRLRGPPHV